MIIILKKNGQLVTDEGNPIDVNALNGAVVLLADPQDGDSVVYDATAGMWKAGNPLPVAISLLPLPSRERLSFISVSLVFLSIILFLMPYFPYQQ